MKYSFPALALVGLLLGVTVLEGVGEGARKAGKKRRWIVPQCQQSEQPRDLSHCPVNPVIYHGSYTTYFALHANSCGSAVMLDTINNAALGCNPPSSDCVSRIANPTEVDHEPHSVYPDYKNNGVPDFGGPVLINSKVTILPGMNGKALQFDVNNHPRYVRIYGVDFNPMRDFDSTDPNYDKYPDQEIKVRVGHEIRPVAGAEQCRAMQLGNYYWKVYVNIANNPEEFYVLLKRP